MLIQGPPPPQPNPEEMLRKARETGDRKAEAAALRALGTRARDAGRSGEAQDHFQRALDIYREDNDLRGVTQVMGEMESAKVQPTERRAPAIIAFIVVLALIGGAAYGLVRLVPVVIDAVRDGGDGNATEDPTGPPNTDPGPVIATEPSPEPVDPGEPVEGEGRLTVRPTTCDLHDGFPFFQMEMQIRVVARGRFEVAVIRGTLTDRRDREIGFGVESLSPLPPGTRTVRLEFPLFEDPPRGELTCSASILNAVQA